MSATAMLGSAPGRATLSVSGRTNSNPSIAADEDTVGVVWAASVAEAGTDVYCAVSRDGGRTFAPAAKVNDGDGDAQTSGEQPPRIAIGRSLIAVSWVSARDGKTIRVARSFDGGRTFEASRSVSGRGAAGNRGWHSMTIDERGDLTVAWLDHRDMALAGPHHSDPSSHGTRDGARMAERSALYVARLTSAGEIEPERRITTGVCYCCKTAIAATRQGEAVAWRQVYPGNIRDIAFARIGSDGSMLVPPARVSADNWQLDGCPDDGPAIAIDAARRTHLVWPTLVRDHGEPAMALFYAISTDGATFTPRERIPAAGTPHHPQIAIGSDGLPVVAWDELENGTRRAAYARRETDAQGRATFVREPPADGEGAYPAIAAARDAIVTAYATGQDEHSQIAVVRR